MNNKGKILFNFWVFSHFKQKYYLRILKIKKLYKFSQNFQNKNKKL